MTRKFNGKRFLEDDIFGSLRNAKKRASNLRIKGYLVRVIREGRTYVTYKRKK